MQPLRSYFSDIEFAAISFHYQLPQPVALPAYPELLLRPILHQTGMELLEPETFERLMAPALPDDPTALRRYQRPAPPFAFQPSHSPLPLHAKETGTISCHLFGDGILLLYELIQIMAHVQPYILTNRTRHGQLVSVSATDAAGEAVTIWEKGMAHSFEPPRITAAWHFDTPATTNDWQLTIFTPARLMMQKKPLFRPNLRHLLPFILRRVTSLCYFFNHVEIKGAGEYLVLNDGIAEESEWLWDDWRNHQGMGEAVKLGGICGRMRLRGTLHEDLIDLLRLGSLMNIGKGAAFGAGAYRVVPGLEIG